MSIKGTFVLLDETPAFLVEWERLAALHAVVGKNVHDARLVAAMVVHGITHLLTFNAQDFQRFTNITVLTPMDVLAASTS
jgi:predicted nucleic acid-binding protein